jgi:hypothetical protein
MKAGASFNPEPTATADVTLSSTPAVAVGSGLNDLAVFTDLQE